jgi:hypothetical protein
MRSDAMKVEMKLHPSTTNARQRSAYDHYCLGPGQPTRQITNAKEYEAKEKARVSSKDIGQLSIQRLRRGKSSEVCRTEP